MKLKAPIEINRVVVRGPSGASHRWESVEALDLSVRSRLGVYLKCYRISKPFSKPRHYRFRLAVWSLLETKGKVIIVALDRRRRRRQEAKEI